MIIFITSKLRKNVVRYGVLNTRNFWTSFFFKSILNEDLSFLLTEYILTSKYPYCLFMFIVQIFSKKKKKKKKKQKKTIGLHSKLTRERILLFKNVSRLQLALFFLCRFYTKRNHLDVFAITKFEQTKFIGSTLHKIWLPSLDLTSNAKIHIAEPLHKFSVLENLSVCRARSETHEERWACLKLGKPSGNTSIRWPSRELLDFKVRK